MKYLASKMFFTVQFDSTKIRQTGKSTLDNGGKCH